jgi:hypothetical protein
MDTRNLLKQAKMFVLTTLYLLIVGVIVAYAAAPSSETGAPGAAKSVPTDSVIGEKSPGISVTDHQNYYSISGSNFKPLSSSDKNYQNSEDCIYLTDGTGGWVGASVNLPHGATIYSMIMFYDIGGAGTVESKLIAYDVNGIEDVLVTVPNNTSTGRMWNAASLDPEHVVHNINYSYSVVVFFSAGNVSTKFCGIRISYYEPETLKVNQIIIK